MDKTWRIVIGSHGEPEVMSWQEAEIGDPGYRGSWLHRYVDFSLGTIIPAVLLVVFLSTVYQIYF